MTQSRIEKIRARIRQRRYDMSAHAMEEMAEDFLDILDIESAILNGRIARTEKDDPRGTKYVVEGTAADRMTLVGVVGRFGGERYVIITVYRVTGIED